MLKLKVATPEKTVFDANAKSVTIKTIDGTVTILDKHIPFVSIIKNGYVRVPNELDLEVVSGFVSVTKESVVNVLISK